MPQDDKSHEQSDQGGYGWPEKLPGQPCCSGDGDDDEQARDDSVQPSVHVTFLVQAYLY